jgi:hypothetical protein
MIKYIRQQKWRLVKWHTKFPMSASLVAHVLTLVPPVAFPKATASMLSIPTSASAAVLALTLVL